MERVRLVLGVLLLIPAFWIIVLNWGIFWRSHIRRSNSSSWIPLLGGCLGAAGLLLLPGQNSAKWCWLPFLLDWGSIPGLSYTGFWLYKNRASSPD